jgi:hypothetical protein
MPLLSRINPDRPPYLIVELPLTGPTVHGAPTSVGEPLVRTA